MPGWFWLFAIALLMAKLVLVSHDEIEIRTADDTGYAVCASAMYWGAPFQPYSYARQPAYPLLIVLVQALGVPMRLAIELLWFGACIALATSVRRCGLSVWAALGVHVLTFLTPLSLWLFNRLLPDAFFGVCMVSLIAGMSAGITAVSRRSAWAWGALAAVAAALGANTRQESPVIYGLIAVGFCVAMWGLWRAWWGGPADRTRLLWTRTLAACVLPLAATLGLTHAFAYANQRTVGLHVTYDLVAPGLKTLYKALLSIPPSGEARLDVPVPREVRERAYAHSVTFKTLEPFLDGEADAENPYKAACKRFAGVDGEFGAWTVWGLRRAAWRSTNYKWENAGAMDAMFAKAAAEIRQAQDSGVLARRRVLSEFLPPEYGQLLRKLPASLRVCYTHSTSVSTRETDPDKQEDYYIARIDAAAVRRIPTAALTDHHAAPPPIWYSAEVVGALDRVKERVAAAGIWSVRVGMIGAVALSLLIPVLLFRARSRRAARGVIVLGVLVLAAIVSRFLLFGVLDACGVFSQPRYMFAASALMPVCLVLAIEGLWHALGLGAPSSGKR